MSSVDRVALLSGSPLFEMLSNQELDAVCALLLPRDIAAGGVIFAEGALGDGLYLIASGEVEVFQAAHTNPAFPRATGRRTWFYTVPAAWNGLEPYAA